MDCKKCFHFDPCDWSAGGSCIPASCEHPDCYASILVQTVEGKVVPSKKRIHDIIDFNPDGNCSRWTAFAYQKVDWFWGLKKTVKVPIGEVAHAE